ncbi:unnamed protein product [Adineta steineri]|uniref:EF-hand domain-containing protein n=1 Tax=Adineta steineri TaxID=433720 RepID=A0A815UQJ1_9BILA|nr:unnamed protein product [Adineta steineri]CAF1520396.1 unnamed protein product [Adineta steineri]CAF4117709.1 unnamed protein product [Adineta steineri]CAF4204715.1 unnamed protein product [Adineta steineri]
MANLDYTVSESVDRRDDKVIEVAYDYEKKGTEEVQDVIYEAKQKDQTGQFRWSIKRDDYEELAKLGMNKTLPFDSFVCVLRPFMMGTCTPDEINEAFRLLDQDGSGAIDIDELTAFIPFLQPSLTKDRLAYCVDKFDINNDQRLDLNEFTIMVSKGIGRDIVCDHQQTH